MAITQFIGLEERMESGRRGALDEDALWDVIDSVRDSFFLGCEEGDTIEECMTDFFDGMQPEWLAFQTDDGTCYVNCTGISDIDGEDTEIALQFQMDDDLCSFSLYAMTVAGVAQSDEFMDEFQAAFS